MVKRNSRIKLISIISLILLINACSSSNPNPEPIILDSQKSGEYSLLIPYESSSIRQYHGLYLGKADLLEIGSRLEDKSKTHFDPKDYYLAEGQVLKTDEIDLLLARESSANPYGLNPPKGSLFSTGSGSTQVLDAVVIADIIELDFYQTVDGVNELSGLSFAIVLNQTLDNQGVSASITEARLYEYGSDMGRKLERYIRTIADMEDIPIYIGLYSTNSTDTVLPGHYFGEGYFIPRSGQFATLNEAWVLFPSIKVTSLDNLRSSQFNSFRSKIVRFIPESLGVIGEGLYVDNELIYLRMTITIQAKTYAEVHALTQYVIKLLDTFTQQDYDMIVRINTINETLALIEKTSDQKLSVIYTY